jgi:CDP-glycerol glycerophosphotransferase
VLRTAYQNSTPPLDENAVYLQSYTGLTATDSQLALHHELRRTHPHLTLYWGINDRSTLLPEGAVGVMMQTREWYDVLARAKYLVTNVDFPRWFARKPGQKVLQTFHGYPAKSMGIRLWRAKNFTPRRIEEELDRTMRDWDLILTPAPEMDQYYRTEYAYEGPILSHGYPRDDILLSDQAPAVREHTRRLLGIEDHQTVVLYAPTWRDDLATSYRSSPLVGHLDLETSSKALGDDYVLLMRGHRFHPGQRRSAEKARLIDVTDYPEINDLILAADVAVLDYSSLRFDFALTGRPMLFLVPDLDRYAGDARGFLYPFEDSAPGPLVQHADHVVELLRDLDRVREEHRAAYEQFNQTYNYLQDGHSAEHVVAAFFDKPGEGSGGLVDPT